MRIIEKIKEKYKNMASVVEFDKEAYKQIAKERGYRFIIEHGQNYVVYMDDDLDLSNGVNLAHEVTVKEANGKPHLYPVSDDALYASTLGYPTITGVITNDTNKDISYMYINFIFYDAGGNIIGINGTGITNIAPGDTKIFSDGLFYCDKALTIDNIARYDVIAEESYYQW